MENLFYELNVTNNRMELRAAIEALKIFKNLINIEIYTDSQYVQKGMSSWIHSWIKKDWKPCKANLELWKELYQLSLPHKIDWTWVRGHSGVLGNERADQLCNEAMDSYKEPTYDDLNKEFLKAI